MANPIENRTMNADQLKEWLKTGNRAIADSVQPVTQEALKQGIQLGIPVLLKTASDAFKEKKPGVSRALDAIAEPVTKSSNASAEPTSECIVGGSCGAYKYSSDVCIDSSVDITSSVARKVRGWFS